jgi:transketolase
MAGLSQAQLDNDKHLLEQAQEDLRYVHYLMAVLFAGAAMAGLEWTETARLYIETVLLFASAEKAAARSVALLRSKARARAVMNAELAAVKAFLASHGIREGLY